MSSTWTVTPEKVQAVIDRLVEVARPQRIILFGSAGTPGHGPANDVDLLLVTRDDADRSRQELARLYRSLRGLKAQVDLLLVSERELEDLGDAPGLVYGEALRTGRTVYDAA